MLVDEGLFICLTMESLGDVDRNVSTAITASLHQAMRLNVYMSLYVAHWFKTHTKQLTSSPDQDWQ